MHVCMNIFKIDKQAHKAINQSIWFLFANIFTASLKQKEGVNVRMIELIVPDPPPRVRFVSAILHPWAWNLKYFRAQNYISQ